MFFEERLDRQRVFWKGWVMSVGGLVDVWERSWIFGSESLGNFGHLEGNFLGASAADFFLMDFAGMRFQGSSSSGLPGWMGTYWPI